MRKAVNTKEINANLIFRDLSLLVTSDMALPQMKMASEYLEDSPWKGQLLSFYFNWFEV